MAFARDDVDLSEDEMEEEAGVSERLPIESSGLHPSWGGFPTQRQFAGAGESKRLTCCGSRGPTVISKPIQSGLVDEAWRCHGPIFPRTDSLSFLDFKHIGKTNLVATKEFGLVWANPPRK